jgi:hypothetical protein
MQNVEYADFTCRIFHATQKTRSIEHQLAGNQSIKTLNSPSKPKVKKPTRPRRGEVRAPAKESPISRQRKQALAQMMQRTRPQSKLQWRQTAY